MSERHDVRIAYIGGGSRYWAYDPLTRLSTDEAWTMFKAMLQRIKEMLPGWRLP
jgi:alpha-galactosidase/6-phospho-beta-glucosidase family protein